MKIVGLTGSIATGKSTVANWLSQLGIPIHDADAVVHQLLSAGGKAVQPIMDFFGPNVGSIETGINRKEIGDLVFAAPERRQQLEAILHPMVHCQRNKFLADHFNAKTPIVVLDVPLLFETGTEAYCDYVIVVHARMDTVISRALSRPGMTMEKLTGILASQMSMDEKMRRADLCLNTDLAPAVTKRHLEAWLEPLKNADALSRLSHNKQTGVDDA